MDLHQYARSFGFFLVGLALLSAPHAAEIGSPGESRRSSEAFQQGSASAEIASDAVRSYINWIVQQTGWPVADIPPIKITTFGQMSDMLLGAFGGVEGIRPAALYSKSEHLIYLADSWNKDDLLDQSILVHELVHHLQIENRIQFECWGRYEAQAYELQAKWLRTQGIKDPYSFLHASRATIGSLAECP